MKQITLQGFIHCKPATWNNDHVSDGMEYSFWIFEDLHDSGYALVTPATCTFEIPEGFNPNGQFIEALEAKKKEIMAEFQNRVTEINRQISELSALTFEPA
jgi:hypothetical protein